MHTRIRLQVRLLVGLVGILAAAGARAGANRWTSSGPYGGFVKFVVDPHEDGRVYTYGTGGTYLSENGGETWNPMDAPGGVLAISPSDPRVLYTPYFRSEDRGATWIEMTRPIPVSEGLFAPIVAIVVHPEQPGTIYAAVDYVPLGPGIPVGVRVFRSDDGGGTWTLQFSDGQSGNSFRHASGFALDVHHPNRLSVAVWTAVGATIYNTSDSGASWAASTADLEGVVLSLEFGPDGTLFAGTYAGAFRSTGSRATWTPINGGLPPEALSWVYVVVHATAPLDLVASTAAGIYTSQNGGGSWALLDPTLVAGNLARGRANPARVYYSGQDDQVKSSVDGGASWSGAAAGLAALGYLPTMGVDPSNGNVVYAGSEGGVWRSDDAGLTWANRSHGLPAPANVREVLVDSSDNSTLYVLANRGVSKSTDSGQSWKAASDGLPSRPYTLVLDPKAPGTLLASTAEGVFRTEDGGANWISASEGLTESVNLLGISGGVAYAQSSQFFRSMDGGRSWTTIGPPVGQGLLIDEEDPLKLIAASYGILTSVDGGATWQGGYIGDPVSFLAQDRQHSERVFAANSNMAFVADRSGTVWEPLGNGLDQTMGLSDLAIDPSGTHLYAASSIGVLEYTIRQTRELAPRASP